MRRLLFIPLLFFSMIASATNYYVAEGGDDEATGLVGFPWETIAKVNSFSFSPGDSCFFNRGDTFTGTLTPLTSGNSSSYITFGAYGTGARPIITPNAVVGGVTWTLYSGTEDVDAVWETEDITYNPGNMLINGETKINKIHDSYFANVPIYGVSALTVMAYADDYELVDYGFTVQFWDGIDALFCYDGSSTTYLRFRGGEDPNDSTLATAVKNTDGVFINGKRYIIIQNLNIVGGRYGVNMNNINYSGSANVIVENCLIESSNRKVYSQNNSNGIIVRNSKMTNNYLSPYNPGAWETGSGYVYGVRAHYYTFMKNLVGDSDSSPYDQGINLAGSNNSSYGDTVLYCVNGISVGAGSNNVVYDCYVEGVSSVGIHFGAGTMDCSAYRNYVINANICMRFQYIDDPVYAGRVNNVYLNRFYNPNAGYWIYMHMGSARDSQTTIYFYANSVICKNGINISSYIHYFPPSGAVFRNNIISASVYASYPYSWVADIANIFDFEYNWVGGDFYGADDLPDHTALWATDASNIFVEGTTFWDHATDPPDFTDILGTAVIGAGVDLGYVYDAAGNVFDTPPSIGAYEIPPVPPTLVESIDVWGTGGATTIESEAGTLQMLKKTLPVDATDTTCVWSVVNGTGTAEISVGGLLTATSDGTVDARATANDASGIYGEEEITISNQNPDAGPPVVTTDGIHSATSISIVCGGEVVSESGGSVDPRGVCWNTTGDPTTADSKTVDGAGLGVFESTLTGLKGNVTYYVRAYATNEEGTAYGSNVVWTTPKITVLRSGGKRLTSGIKGQKYIIISR